MVYIYEGGERFRDRGRFFNDQKEVMEIDTNYDMNNLVNYLDSLRDLHKDGFEMEDKILSVINRINYLANIN